VNQQLPAGWIVTILALIVYFFIGILLAGEVALLFEALSYSLFGFSSTR